MRISQASAIRLTGKIRHATFGGYIKFTTLRYYNILSLQDGDVDCRR